MKKHVIFLGAAWLASSLHAQTVPLFMNYQGRITGGTGVPLGSTGTAPNFVSAPINRKVIFRLFDAATAGNRLWSEQQTITIALGEFSVLLGQGIDAVYAGATETRPALDTVFTGGGAVTPAGPTRFMEIVVDDGSGTFTAADVPISPRQRITSTAYSFRAAIADTVPASAINAASLATGSVTGVKILDSAITTDKVANLGILNEDLAPNSVTADKIADGSVGNADLANNAVTAAKLDPAIGTWSATGGNVSRLTGNVGIGKQPTVALDVAGAISATGNITATGALTGSSITTTGPFSATTISASAGMNIAGTNVLELGAGVAGKEFSAGKIGYQTFTANALDIVGAGTTGGNRRIKLWAEGGTEINGRVGIGTANPAVPLDVEGMTSITMADNGYGSNDHTYAGSGSTLTWVASGVLNAPNTFRGAEVFGMDGHVNIQERYTNAPVGIRSQGWIASARGVVVYSDRRIKRDAKASETAQDLAAIQKLEVTDYRMVDPAGDGTAWRKGFIAQEVEKVIPGAVTRSVEFVPDIFLVATGALWNPGANTLSLTLGKDHDLKVGDRVRLHVDGARLDLNVSAVPSVREFVVDKCDRAPKKVMVYGKQVNDFRTVDYDRIFTTSVGALQELKKEKDAEVKALQEENAGLRDRLAALEANDKSRDAKLAAIETLLNLAAKPAARTVSVNAGK